MLIWADIETTGLHPEYHDILEVALVITNDNLEFVEGRRLVLSGNISKGDKFVREMHEKSGLLKELQSCVLWDLASSDNELSDWPFQKKCGGPPLASSSVHFDRMFLRSKMPNLI